MPRKREVPKRKILNDPKYNDWLVAKFINSILRRGKKSLAEKVLYRAFAIMEKKAGEEPLKLFKKAIENVKPQVEVKSRRVGGSTYQVPVEIRPERKTSLSIRWLIRFAKERGEKSMEERLAAEFTDAANNRGSAIKKREDTHRMAEANKAFAHYRW